VPVDRAVHRPVVLGIVGDSAAGKTTLTAGVAAILGADRVASVCSDDYHRYGREERAARGITPLHPDCNHLDILEQHLGLLRQGQPILKPVYDHRDGSLAPPEHVEPRPFVVVEGLLGYHSPGLRDRYDVKVYLEPPEELRVRWKIARDTAKRGYTREQVLRQIAEREADTQAFVRPQRAFADIVVAFHPPEAHAGESGARLNARHLLRPTLPHPDLTPIVGHGGGLRLERTRDADGQLAEVLEIRGDIGNAEAERLEELLWSLIPEAGQLRANVGAFDGGRMSHPLALTQLLIACHMVKAAADKRAA
jgi:phosphoribulokinase